MLVFQLVSEFIYVSLFAKAIVMRLLCFEMEYPKKFVYTVYMQYITTLNYNVNITIPSRKVLVEQFVLIICHRLC